MTEDPASNNFYVSQDLYFVGNSGLWSSDKHNFCYTVAYLNGRRLVKSLAIGMSARFISSNVVCGLSTLQWDL